jgi:hypothetical protein
MKCATRRHHFNFSLNHGRVWHRSSKLHSDHSDFHFSNCAAQSAPQACGEQTLKPYTREATSSASIEAVKARIKVNDGETDEGHSSTL